MNLLHTIGLMTRAEHEAKIEVLDDLLKEAQAGEKLALDTAASLRAKFKRAATDLAAQAEEIAALSAAFPADVLAVMDAMSDFLSFTSEQIAADATSESGIQITPTRVTAIRKALHTFGLAGFGTLHDEDSERVMGRGYWLTGEGVDVRRTLNQAAGRKRMAGKRGKGQ